MPRDQFGAGGEVDAVEARPPYRRGGDPHVHLTGARLAEHGDQRALGGPADDSVVDHHEPAAGDGVPERVQLQLDAPLPDGLAGLDEGPAHVGVLDQPLAEGDAAGLGEADRRGRPRFGHRDDHVGVRGMLGGEPPADRDPGGVHPPAGDRGVRAGQVDVLEQAPARLRRGERPGPYPAPVDADQLARLDLADEPGPHDVQRGRLAGHHPAGVQAAEHERPEAVRVPRRVQRLLVHEDQRVRPLGQRQDGRRRGLDCAGQGGRPCLPPG